MNRAQLSLQSPTKIAPNVGIFSHASSTRVYEAAHLLFRPKLGVNMEEIRIATSLLDGITSVLQRFLIPKSSLFLRLKHRNSSPPCPPEGGTPSPPRSSISTSKPSTPKSASNSPSNHPRSCLLRIYWQCTLIGEPCEALLIFLPPTQS